MKNILFIHNPRRAPFSFGGIERVTLMLAEWFSAHGYRSYVVAVDFDMSVIPDDKADKIERISTPRRKMSDRAYCDFVAECVVRFSIDVVVCQGGYLKHMKLLRRKLSPSRVPIVYCNHSQVLWEELRSMSCHDRCHGSGLWASLLRRMLLRRVHWRAVRRYRRIYDSVDRYVVLCQGYIDELYRIVGDRRAREGKCCALYNPALQISAGIDWSAKRRQVLFVGRLSYADKRVDMLLTVWGLLCDEFTDWELLIVGDGMERETLERMVAERGIRNVRFCGATSDPSKYYADASIVCLTSVYEGWGMVLVEGQRYGTVPVAFGCSAGVREILSGGGGYVVEPFDIGAYVDTLRELLSNNEKRRSAASAARDKSRTYDIDKVGENWVHMFEGLDSH